MRAAAPADLACVWPGAAELGEGPVWRVDEAALWFVNIKGLAIHRLDTATGEVTSWPAPAQPGFIAPVAGGGWIAGLKTGLHRFEPATGAFTPLARFGPDRPGNRINDGAVDAQGRLWFGTMDDGEAEPTGALWRLDAEGPATRCDDGYVVTNGPAFSPDGATLYHCDSVARRIYAFDLAADGSLGPRRLFAELERGYPDGPVVDAEGCLWVALWGGWGLNRYAPTGELIGHVALPVAQVTKAAFGGPDLRTVYCTTAWKGLSDAERFAQPLAGAVFSFRADVAGLAGNAVRLGA